MKVLWLSPSDMLTEPVMAGLVGHEIDICRYDRVGVPPDRAILDHADRVRPDIILYIAQNGGPFLAGTDVFIRLKKLAPTVFLLFDGTDQTWARLLEEYRAHDVFTTTVNIDGNRDWAQGPKDLTLLTPTAPHFYS